MEALLTILFVVIILPQMMIREALFPDKGSYPAEAGMIRGMQVTFEILLFDVGAIIAAVAAWWFGFAWYIVLGAAFAGGWTVIGLYWANAWIRRQQRARDEAALAAKWRR